MAGLLKYSDFENWREVDKVVQLAEKDVIKDVRRLSHVTFWGNRDKLAAFQKDHALFFETNFRTLTYDEACRFYEEHNESAVSEFLDLNLMLRVTKLIYRRGQFEQLLDRVFYTVGFIQAQGFDVVSVYLSSISEAVFVGIDGSQFDRFQKELKEDAEHSETADFSMVAPDAKFDANNPFTVRISTSGSIVGLPGASTRYGKSFDVDLDATRWVPMPIELMVYHDRDGKETRASSPAVAKTARQARDAKNTMLRWKLGLTQ